jgi:CoA:oxalate CoA-transferase
MLAGIKVIDLSRNLAAPFCTMILGDMGADVIKVEVPETGDDARGFSPIVHGESGYFMSVNRNKRSMTLNLKTPRGKDILERLLEDADVLVDNFRPGVLDRLGFSYKRLRERFPRLICASLSGFGQTGPYREKAAYDLVVQGYGGIMSITGEPGGEPTRVGISLGDLAAGLYLAIGILGALAARNRTGRGDFIDVAMLDCQVALLENAIIRYYAAGQIPRPVGNRHPSITPFESFRSKDGYIIVCAGNQRLWEDFCHLVGRPELAADPRFATNDKRTENHALLAPILAQVMAVKTTADWLAALDGAGIPCAPINDIRHVTEDEQIRARDMIVALTHPRAGIVKMPGFPVKTTEGSRCQPYVPAPSLGEHTEEILHGLGLDAAIIAALKKDNVI